MAASDVGVAGAGASASAPARVLQRLVTAAGLAAAVLFVVVGLRFHLQLYADGSMFSYAVAAQDSWAFHWHNISGRLFVYLATVVPAETFVALSGDAPGGVDLYGFLFFAAAPAGLAATFVVDASRGRIIFTSACAATVCLCPLVFGFPTEMWLAVALFWPTLAAAHYARHTVASAIVIFLLLLALVLSHEGGLVLAVLVMLTALLRGPRSTVASRTAAGLFAALSLWVVVKLALPPDAYDGEVMRRAALDFFDLATFRASILVLQFAALAAYAAAYALARRLAPAKAHVWAALGVAAALGLYWLLFDHALHGEERYYQRTILLLGTAALGGLAGVLACAGEADHKLAVPFVADLIAPLRAGATIRFATGAFVLIALIHVVETAKFVRTFVGYTAAVAALATGSASDPALGDRRFVSSARIDPGLNRLSWFSTTPYLSVLLAPKLAPARLVVDPSANYFWLSCDTARANERAERAVPRASRALVRIYACLHR